DNESDDEAPFDAGTPGPFSNDPLEELKNQVNHINHLLVQLDKQDAAIIEINDRLTAQTANTEKLDRQVIQQKSSIDNVANSVVQYGRAVKFALGYEYIESFHDDSESVGVAMGPIHHREIHSKNHIESDVSQVADIELKAVNNSLAQSDLDWCRPDCAN
ncbi:hypothetical protein AeMF1_017711, partial [Aphanomyces euteiches]